MTKTGITTSSSLANDAKITKNNPDRLIKTNKNKYGHKVVGSSDKISLPLPEISLNCQTKLVKKIKNGMAKRNFLAVLIKFIVALIG